MSLGVAAGANFLFSQRHLLTLRQTALYGRYVHGIRRSWTYPSYMAPQHIGAVWLCGNQSANVIEVAEVPEGMTMCPKCKTKMFGSNTTG